MYSGSIWSLYDPTMATDRLLLVILLLSSQSLYIGWWKGSVSEWTYIHFPSAAYNALQFLIMACKYAMTLNVYSRTEEYLGQTTFIQQKQ